MTMNADDDKISWLAQEAAVSHWLASWRSCCTTCSRTKPISSPTGRRQPWPP